MTNAINYLPNYETLEVADFGGIGAVSLHFSGYKGLYSLIAWVDDEELGIFFECISLEDCEAELQYIKDLVEDGDLLDMLDLKDFY